jgi:hypothetical protein
MLAQLSIAFSFEFRKFLFRGFCSHSFFLKLCILLLSSYFTSCVHLLYFTYLSFCNFLHSFKCLLKSPLSSFKCCHVLSVFLCVVLGFTGLFLYVLFILLLKLVQHSIFILLTSATENSSPSLSTKTSIL